MDPTISLFVFGLGSFVCGIGALFWGIVKHLGTERKEGDILLHSQLDKANEKFSDYREKTARELGEISGELNAYKENTKNK